MPANKQTICVELLSLARKTSSGDSQRLLHDISRAFNNRDLESFSWHLQTLVYEAEEYGIYDVQDVINRLAETVLLTHEVEYAALLIEYFVEAGPVAGYSRADTHNITELLDSLPTTMTEKAVAAMRHILAPSIRVLGSDGLHSIDQVLVAVYACPGLADAAVRGGIPAVNNFLEASRANVPTGTDPADDSRHRMNLSRALNAAIIHQTEAEKNDSPERARKYAAIVEHLVEQGARVFDNPLLNFDGRATNMIAAWTSPLEFEPEETRARFGPDFLPVSRRVLDIAQAQDPRLLEDVMQRQEAQKRLLPQQALGEPEAEARDLIYVNLIYSGAAPSGLPVQAGPRTTKLLERQWRPSNSIHRLPGLRGIHKQAEKLIVTVLLCAKKRDIELPVELWLDIFERLSLGDMANP